MTETITPDDRVTQAEEALQVAQAAHDEARAASDEARTRLAGLESAADRGEPVDVHDYTAAKSDLGLKSRRTSALTGQVAAAQAELTAAQEAQFLDKLRQQARDLPDPSKAREKAVKAVQTYLDAVKERVNAVHALYQDAQSLPAIEHPAPAGADGWPNHTSRFANGRVEMSGRIGHLVLDGQRIDRNYVPEAAEKLADQVGRLGGAYRRW